jgi:predicted lipid carrier protein YhbT
MKLLTIPHKLQQSFEPITKRLLNPQSLSKAASKMPFVLNAALVEQLCNKAFNEQITDGDFEFLEGRILQIELLDAALWVGLSFARDKIKCVHFNTCASCSDVTLSIRTTDAISLILQEIDPDTLFFQRKLNINGDTNLAHNVKNTIDTLDPDVLPTYLRKIIQVYKKILL